MLLEFGVCQSLAKGGNPRCATESSRRGIPVSAVLAGVGLLLAFLSTLGCCVRAPGLNMAEEDNLVSVDYEVFGKVQGVFFRKYTQVSMSLKGFKSYTECSSATVELKSKPFWKDNWKTPNYSESVKHMFFPIKLW
ncbi:acylphosphatase-1 isoform X2 [Cavia porcellus]|uniref:acylphosphatase-1 isoform X2 n=1 Tax=Cavia porcellus TaxID=10141 RepID=UPI000661E9A4|nr:acylphosphatase-1 isoform X4 [Cavia porcellus]